MIRCEISAIRNTRVWMWRSVTSYVGSLPTFLRNLLPPSSQ